LYVSYRKEAWQGFNYFSMNGSILRGMGIYGIRALEVLVFELVIHELGGEIMPREEDTLVRLSLLE
jgi:hypothetical protein